MKGFYSRKAYQAGDISCIIGEGIEKYFRLFVSFKPYFPVMICNIKNVLLVFLLPVLTSSCNPKKPRQDIIDYKTEMMEADRAFSKLSEEKGMKYALMQYIDGKGVLLRPGTVPIIGVEAIDYISQGNDTSYIMTWEPNGGTVAKSGELGYTYGVYSFKPKNKDTVIYGTYVSVWKRLADGKWKFVLQTGNEGIE